MSNLVQAQTPVKESKSVVWKFTETWCVPCGSWGWTTANSVISDIDTKGYYVGVMGSSSPNSMNANCYDVFANNFPVTGYPTFVVNNTDGGYDFSAIKPIYTAFATSEAVASAAGFIQIENSTISVSTKTKFWSNTNGDYYIAAYIIEDKVKAGQASQTGIVDHHFLMRGTMMSDNSPWGQSLSSGAIAENTEIIKSFSLDFDTTLWNKENISVLLVIYKKEGNNYNVVNSIKAISGSTNINNISGVETLTLYPNPLLSGKN
jgi:hypothetical protein